MIYYRAVEAGAVEVSAAHRDCVPFHDGTRAPHTLLSYRPDTWQHDSMITWHYITLWHEITLDIMTWEDTMNRHHDMTWHHDKTSWDMRWHYDLKLWQYIITRQHGSMITWQWTHDMTSWHGIIRHEMTSWHDIMTKNHQQTSCHYIIIWHQMKSLYDIKEIIMWHHDMTSWHNIMTRHAHLL